MATHLNTETAQAEPAAAEERRGLTPAAARSLATLERVAYGAGGLAAIAGPELGNGWLHLGALAVGGVTAARLWRRAKRGLDAGLLITCQRVLPPLAWSGIYTGALLAPGTSWWEVAVPAAWTGLGMWAVPATRAQGLRRAVEELPQTIEAQGAALVPQQAPAEMAPAGYTGALAAHWAASEAAAGTRLVDVHQCSLDRPDFEAVIQAMPGKAVPTTLDTRAVAAIYDVPESAVSLAPVPGRGPGHLAVRVAPSAAQERGGGGLDALWAAKVSGPGGIAPGMRLVDYRVESDRAVLLVEAAEDRMIDLPRLRLARALGVEDPELVMVETDGMAVGVVSIYREHPLFSVREATADDLRMDADGRFVLGLQHDGRPARWALYDRELGGLTDLLVGAPGSGKSVTLLTILAAERTSGVVSIVADAQDGMSLPEASGRVFHFGAGRAAMGATLAAACAVADYREQVSAANGWGSFTRGEPWELVNVTLDEINRVLASDSDAAPEFKKWVAGMIGRFQLTGRKLGMGIRFAGQSIHLADLGDSEKIRANAKNGSVWLGRVNSSTTKSMATDMTNSSIDVTPIPQYFGAGGASEVEAAWRGEEAPRGPVTAGMAWLIQSGRPSLMRVFKATKENKTYPGLIRLLEAAPTPGLSPAEADIFRRVYAEVLPRAEALLAGETDDEDDDGDGGPRRRHKKPSPTPTTAAYAPPRPLRDLVLDALADGQPRRTRDIRAAVGVGTEGGPAAGSVDNTLGRLADEGLVARVAHGTWQLAPTES